MILKWILEDNGKVLTATMSNPIGVVFKVRPVERRNGQMTSRSEVWVGNTTRWGEPRVFEVAANLTSHHPDSVEAKAECIKAFKSWADSVVTVATSDGHGNTTLEI